jgi:TPP-dependent pyruvate/acetoin dehydrogenase alpha subunit
MAIAETWSPAALDKARLLDMYARMVQIRPVEDAASKKIGSRPWRRIPGEPIGRE